VSEPGSTIPGPRPGAAAARGNPAAAVGQLHPQPESGVRDGRKNVEINIGKACNNRCVFCLDGLPKAEDRSYMPWPAMQAELRRWAEAGYESVGFLGGEPTTYPHIVEAVGLARSLGFSRVTLATNATKLRLPAFRARLLEAGLTRLTVSMHGHTAALEDRLTRVPGNFAKKVTALQGLAAARAQGRLPDGLSINIVINGWNYLHLPRMLRFFYEEMGVDDIRANFLRPEGYAIGDAALTARYSAVVPVLVKCVLLSELHFKRTFTFGGFPLCVLPAALRDDPALLERHMGEYRDLRTAASIATDGGDHLPTGRRVVPDTWTDFPTAPVVQIDPDGSRSRFNWQDRKRFDMKGHPAACGACSRAQTCEGVWKGYLDIWGDGEFTSIAPPPAGRPAPASAPSTAAARAAWPDAVG
jgi:hypothetical protein